MTTQTMTTPTIGVDVSQSCLNPPLRPLPDAELRQLRTLVSRRRQLIAMQTQENNRSRPTEPATGSLPFIRKIPKSSKS